MTVKIRRNKLYLLIAISLLFAFSCSQQAVEKIVEEIQNVAKTKASAPLLTVESSETPDNAGNYYATLTVKMASETANSAIWYTFDGTEPSAENKNALKYSEPIKITRYRQIKAVTIPNESKYKKSDIAVYEYKLKVRTPVVKEETSITIDCTTDSSVIKYSFDGDSALYSNPLTYTNAITKPTGNYMLYVLAKKEGWADSALAVFDKKSSAEVTGLNAIAGNGKVTLSWTDPGDSDFSKVEITYNSETISVDKGVQSAVISSLTNSTEYTFTIKTVDTTGNKSSGTTAKATPRADIVADTTPPSEVSSLLAVSGNGKVTLSWTDPGDSDLKSIEVTYNSEIVTVSKGSQSAVVSSLANGTEYTFTIKTVDTAGNKSSGIQKKATPKADIVADTTPPSEVSSLSATAGNGKVTLSWTDPGDSDFSKVEVTYNSETLTVIKGVQSAVISSLTNGTEYTFTIKTIDTTGNKSSGTQKKAMPKADIVADTTPPAEVASLSATAGNGSVTLSWTDPSDTDLSRIEITYGTTTLNVNKGIQSTTISGLTNGMLYTFKIKSIDLSGNKSTGVEKTSTPKATVDTTAPGEVTGLTATVGSSKVTLKWTDPGDIDFSKVEITYNSQTVTVNKGVQFSEIGGLTNATEYTFTVKTLDSNNNRSTGLTIKATPQAISVTGVTLNKNSTNILVNGKETLIATINPSDATNQNVTWTSSNISVATVSNSGEVTGILAGNAVISAKTADGGKEATCSVTVSAVAVSVTGVSLNKTTINILKDGEDTLVETISPLNATNRNVTWSSSNTSIATVNGGVVTGIAAGNAVITVKTADGGKESTCLVTVSNPVVAVNGVTLSETTANMVIGENKTLTPAFVPSNATNKGVTWSSSNISVATVNGGVVTGFAVGTTTITVTTADGGKKATCNITVSVPIINVSSVSLNKSSTSILVGGTETLTATILPDNATDKTVSWTSSDTNILTVSNTGFITGKAAGNATVTVKTTDGGKEATCLVTVTTASVAVTGVSLPATASVYIGKTTNITATIIPSGATNQNVTWSSSDNSIATVNNGEITGVALGNATIKVTTADGGKEATCDITVDPIAVAGVDVAPLSLSLIKGNNSTLVATIIPSGATNQNVTWSSSNTAVATVSSNGEVTAVAAGSTVITVETADGGKKATCSVTVTNPFISVTGVTLNKATTSMKVGDNETLSPTVSPDDASNKAVTWSSSNTAVATVSNSGVVTAVAVGTAIITVETDNGGKKATCTVTVSSATVSVTGVTLNKSSMPGKLVGEKETLIATINPAEATNQSVTWSSSNIAVATVTSSGEVEAKSVGSAIITVTTADGGKIATCSVTVISTYTVTYNGNNNSSGIPPSSASYGSGSTVSVASNSGNLARSGYTFGGWNTKDDGTGTNYTAGTGTFSILSSTILYAKWTPILVTSITLNKSTTTINVGANETLTPTVLPADALNKVLTWSSSDDTVATVDNTGKVTAIKSGSATITATSTDGSNKNSTCTVTVPYGSGGIGFQF